MKLLTYKKTALYIVVFIMYSIFSMFVYNKTGVFIHRAMIWNLFLALLPLVFANAFLQMMKKGKKIIALICCICWLLLFPNVPYLITDFIHISPLVFYDFTPQGSFYIRDIWVWIELLHIGCGVLVGFFAGYHSLYKIHRYVQRNWNNVISWGMVVLVSLLSGFGVFLGRFLRLNSWDVLQPMNLVKEVYEGLDLSFSIPFTILMAIFLMISYGAFYLCCHRRVEVHHEEIICK